MNFRTQKISIRPKRGNDHLTLITHFKIMFRPLIVWIIWTKLASQQFMLVPRHEEYAVLMLLIGCGIDKM